MFAFLAWHLPKRAAQVGGKGMALAMGGELLAQGAVTAVTGTGRRSAASGRWRRLAGMPSRARVACSRRPVEGPAVDETHITRMGARRPYWRCQQPSEAALEARIAAAYEEARRRDTALEVRLYHAHVREVALLVLLLGLGAVLGWVFAGRMHVHAFVQVVQVDDAGKVHLLGDPQAVLTYTPPEGLWMDMLGEWVRKVRWRGMDAELAQGKSGAGPICIAARTPGPCCNTWKTPRSPLCLGQAEGGGAGEECDQKRGPPRLYGALG